MSDPDEIFVYDLLGNRDSYTDRAATTTTYTHNTDNQYTQINVGALTHDSAGNLTVDEDRGYAFQYDHDNRLTKGERSERKRSAIGKADRTSASGPRPGPSEVSTTRATRGSRSAYRTWI